MTEQTIERPRWVNAVIGGVAVGVLAFGIAIALNLGGSSESCACDTPRAAAVAEPSSTTTPPDATPPTTGVSRTITVTGQRTATVKPDTATVQLGVSVPRPTANAALQQANKSAAALIAALKAAGVADDDIATSNLSIWPQYDNSQVTGYTASNTVSAKVRDIDRTGPVIDAAAEAAGDDISISGVSFGLSDPEQSLAAA